MKPATLLLLSLCVCATATAQSASRPALASPAQPGLGPGMSCPIGMQARHDFFFRKDLVSGDPAQKKDGGTGGVQSMQIRLTLTNSDARRITRARIVVHGTNGLWRTVPVGDPAGKPEVTQSMDARFEPGEGREVDAYLVLQGFTAIQSIHLDTVTYADGSRWKAAGACRVAPDPFMLVAAQ